jgi:hypothetical protein
MYDLIRISQHLEYPLRVTKRDQNETTFSTFVIPFDLHDRVIRLLEQYKHHYEHV